MLMKLRNIILPSFIRDLKKSEKGTVLIEFAYVFPVTIVLLIGGFETFRLMMAHRKSNMTVMSVGNLFSQNKVMKSHGIKNIFDAVENIMKPLDLGSDGQIFISYVTGTSGGNIINQQCKGTTNTAHASKIGYQGQKADLAKIPGTFSIAENETVVISEVVYKYEPVFVNFSSWMKSSMFAAHDVYHIAVQKPRYGSIELDGCP